MNSEIQEVSYYWILRPGKGPVSAVGNLTMWLRCFEKMCLPTVWRMDPKRTRQEKLRGYCDWKGGGRWESMGTQEEACLVSTGPPAGDPGLLRTGERLRTLAQLFFNCPHETLHVSARDREQQRDGGADGW